ncbi:protein RETARDED ROOT GROWTH, mitochondrial-like [Phragmites australis]|uniref:protein RETARDED ROOT GROWTH, mitochondrial-like n=1 Tax=Phragmites australis TaxID=29695 RepID=UPI002D78563F|nr:protein RETARDED ROOT GROWTH, mitochondrial-like [Phragmites australis]
MEGAEEVGAQRGSLRRVVIAWCALEFATGACTRGLIAYASYCRPSYAAKVGAPVGAVLLQIEVLTTLPPPSAGHLLARGPRDAAAHGSPFSRLFLSATAIAPHNAYDSGLGGSAFYAWIRTAVKAVPAPAPPQDEEDEGLVRYIPVKAYFLSTSIDLKSMQAEDGSDIVPPSTRLLNYIALRYSEFPPEIMDIGVKYTRFCYRYVVVFQYSSAMTFNIVDHEAEYYLDIIRKHASGWLPEMRKDDYAVVEKPSLTTWMKGLDYTVLKSIDTDGIHIILSVLGQSIALD